ncbi:TB182 protein, partial [Calonectris borealis]|nr:TB182 protein [Calonectris borealis]
HGVSPLLASLAGNARPKPPVRPKPRVLPKPAVPAKPSLPHPPLGLRHPRPELPSAEKMNRLAGPQPYSGGSSGGPLRRPSFTLKSSETPNGKGLPSPPVAAAEDSGSTPREGVPPAPPTLPRKGPASFKVTPVPVASKPERFPGTTVEEILAKMDSREGPGSPDRARLSLFCPDPSSRFGSKTFTAFRRRPSGEADGAPPGEARQTPQPAVGELGTGDDGRPIAETSPPSPLPRPLALPMSPQSPRPPACAASAPGAPFRPGAPSASAPGSPDVPPELPAPGSPTLAPGAPESPAQPPAEVSATSIQAPGAPSSAAEPRLGVSRSPGSPHTPGEGSPDTASPPGTPELPLRVTCPPGSPEAATEYRPAPRLPPEPPTKASRPPGSPEGPDDSPVPPQTPEGPDFSPRPPSRDSGLRRSSEGVLQPPTAGQGMGELGGSLSTLPCPGDLLSEPSLGSESGWSLSQSFEWTFPSRGARRLASPPRSPIQETADSGLSEEGESDGEDPAPCPLRSRRDSGSEGPGPTVASSRGAEGAPCPGGPVAQREAEGSAEEEEEEEEEGEAERDATVSRSPLCVTEPSRDPAEPKPPAQPSLLIEATPLDLAPPDPPSAADSAWAPAGDSPVSLQGPGGPGRAEGSSRGPDPHADPGWLTELLTSPGARATGHGSPDAEGPEDLLGWSRKDLCSEFGIGRPHQASTFDWTREAWGTGYGLDSAGSREEIDSGKAAWSSSYSVGHGQQPDEEPSSRQPSWAGGYGSGDPESQDGEITPAWAGEYGTSDAEMKDRELTPDWARKYGSRDAETKDKDLTLGWAGRSSTGDTGTPEKEFSPSRPAWGSTYSTCDMESQDREFSPSRPAWTGEYSTRDMESQDREFSPSRLAWESEYRSSDMESQDRECSPSRPAWGSAYSTADMESQDRECSPSRPAWGSTYSTCDMESQDREFSPSRLAWDSEYRSRDIESQDREFGPSRRAGDSEDRSRDMESQAREFSPSRLAWDSEYRSRDMESQDREFSPSRPAWDDEHSTRDMETRDREFSPSRPAWASEYSSREMETQDSGSSPSRPTWDDKYSTRDVETQDREFSPSRAAWASEYSSTNTKKEERDFSPGRLSWASEHSIGQTELVNAFGLRKDDLPGSCAPDPPAQEPGWGSTDRQERGATDSRDWAEELRGAECRNQFGIIGTERVPDPSSAGASSDGLMSWAGMRSGDLQEPLGDWHRDLSFGSSDATSCVGTGNAGGVGPGQMAWDQGLGSLPAAGSSSQPREAGVEEPGWSQDLDAAGWSVELCDAEAKRREWASAFGARCAARSRDFGAGERSPGDDAGSADGWPESPMSLPASLPSPDPKFCPSLGKGLWGNFPEAPPPCVTSWERGESPGHLGPVLASWEQHLASPCLSFPWRLTGARFGPGEGLVLAGAGGTLGSRLVSLSRSIHLSDPSPPMGDGPADPPAAESPQSEPPSPTEEEGAPPELAAAPRSPRASPLLPEAAGGTLPDAESEEAPSDHLDGKRPPSREEKWLFLGAPQPEGPTDHAGQEFTFLEDTEVLDSSVYRSKANLGRKRRHRAPALRPGAASEGDSWIFRDSTEPRPARQAASSDEEAAEEPKSRRVRASPSSKGVKVPLFPGLNTSALKAKLRGRNRSAEEGAPPGDSKATPPKDPHVQRSKSCKIPGLSGKPLALPPKPEKSSG